MTKVKILQSSCEESQNEKVSFLGFVFGSANTIREIPEHSRNIDMTVDYLLPTYF